MWRGRPHRDPLHRHRGGRVQGAAIVGTSGSERLDATALKLLRHASLRAFPVSMAQARIVITTTMRYSLR